MKTHNGHREIYEDDEYLTRFIKGNLRLQSWIASIAPIAPIVKLAIWKLQM
jgi:hypothetical protein